MNIQPTKIDSLFVIEPTRLVDDRGFFARTFCETAFREHGIDSSIRQCNVSFNHKRGTLRGMHLQREPHAEAKLVRCTRGAIYDVIVDVRPESPTFCQWVAFELSADNGRQLAIGKGLAHGFQTLTDDTEVFYQMSESFHPTSSTGYHYNDPAFQIEWPLPVVCLSDKDNAWSLIQLQTT